MYLVCIVRHQFELELLFALLFYCDPTTVVSWKFKVVSVKGVLGAQGQANLLQDVNDHLQEQQLWSVSPGPPGAVAGVF
jgi:hypothetical protein